MKKETKPSKRAEFLSKCEAAKPDVLSLIERHGFGVVAHVINKVRQRDKLKSEAEQLRRKLGKLESEITQVV